MRTGQVKLGSCYRRRMGVIPKLLDGSVRLAALLLATACLAAAAAGQGGRLDPTLDMFNHLEPLWLAGALAAALFGRRDWPTVLLAGLAAVLCALQLGPELAAALDRTRPAPGAERIKLIQFNAYHRNADPAASARWLLAQDADVVVVEEGFEAAAPVVRALAARYPHHTACPGPLEACAPLIFSRRRPLASGQFPGAGLAARWATFPGAGGPFTVVGLHSTHPYPPPLQQEEHARLEAALRPLPTRRLILAGDFNSTPWSFTLRRLDRALPLTRRTHAIATWPSGEAQEMGRRFTLPFPVLPIDHVYAGAGWRTVEVDRGPALGSDHRPIVAVLQAAP